MAFRIMIVEDEYWTALDLAHEVRKRGATVTGPFSSIAEVIEELSGPRRPDAAVVDVRLRSMDVFSVADMLTQKEIPFVFATAHVPRDIPERFAERRISRSHLQLKPVSRRCFRWPRNTGHDGTRARCRCSGRRFLQRGQ